MTIYSCTHMATVGFKGLIVAGDTYVCQCVRNHYMWLILTQLSKKTEWSDVFIAPPCS